MLTSAVSLLRERGAAGVTVDAVLAHSGAPRGSVYHHFPGGRSELILSAVGLAGEHIGELLDEAIADGSPRRALERFVWFWKQTLIDTDYLAGCPVLALAVDSHQNAPQAAELLQEVFASWQTRIQQLLVGAGTPADRAKRLSTLTIAAIEGAVVLCRVHRDTGPLDDVLTEFTTLLDPS
ncbi:TetR/AcrR family transcriptional regulator [Haloechinothrix sp. YIM 98757]|uniref:TetR/AcrR family transcriptional regulator n=2 Tax=Haloechinothrix aidingensis TaxID=2752311 RepID=A0A838A3K4_9PSEU|nr:TetR/AcrR family transcriptional regulator [Haloechinothrix aidingensis]